MKRIGLFGGTFDPVHLGHFVTAVSTLEMLKLDEVWFVPAAQSPLKGALTAAEHRVAMLQSMISGVSELKICDVELRRAAPSYTVDTVEELISTYPDCQFHLMMSDDVAASLPRWREPHKILQMLPIVVSRRGDRVPPQTGDAKIDAAIVAGYLETPIFEVNATDVRERLRQGKGCQHLISESVLAYIESHNLYTGTAD